MNTENFQELQQRFPSLIPLNGKKPFEDGWQRWCEEVRPFNPEDFKNRNAGICCGPANGMIVFDVDHVLKMNKWLQEKGFTLPRTRTHSTGSGLPHYLYQYPKNGKRYGNRSFSDPAGEIDPKTGKVIKIFDIKAIGGQVVAPGSIHPDTGKPYTVRHDIPIVPAPEWLLELAEHKESERTEQAQGGGAWDGDLANLPVSFAMKKLIREGELKGTRSEAIMSVINSLVSAGLNSKAIFEIFEAFPIGEKYREKGQSKERWLLSQIDKAKSFVTTKGPVEAVTPSLNFPDVIDGVAGQFTTLLKKYIEAPPQFPYMSFLTCLGSISSGRLTLATIHKPQPRLYNLLLGPSGESRKSTTINQTVDFFNRTLTYDFKLNICHGVGSDIGLLKKLKKSSSLLLVLDEFKSLTSKSSIKGSNLLPAISTLFDKNTYENQTKLENISIENAHLSILGASTPETYESTWQSEFTSIGLNNRLWIVPGEGERGQAFPPEIPESEFMPIKNGLGEILSIVGESLKLNLTPEAENLYAQWYDNRENSVHSQRLESYALRLMCLLTVNELKTEVSKSIVQKVIDLCNWQLIARKLYTPVDADNVVAKMEEKIRRVLDAKGNLTNRDIFLFTNARRVGRFYFNNAIKNLKDSDEIGFNAKTKKYWLKV